MEWQQILGFYQIAKLGSFTKAAHATLRTQSALSLQIKSLEEEIGCQLFERIGRRKVNLTLAGESFLKFAVALFDRYDQFKEEITELGDQKTGQIRIAAPFETLYYLIPENLQKYNRAYPNIDIIVIDSITSEIIQLIQYGDIDFGLAIEHLVPSDLVRIRWKNVGRVLMTPLGHPLTKAKRITVKSIARYPLILPPMKYYIRRRFDEKCKQQKIKYHTVVESPNVVLGAECVEMGLGIAIVADSAAQRFQQENRNIAFIPLKNGLAPVMAVVMRKDKKLPDYQKAFINIFLGETLL